MNKEKPRYQNTDPVFEIGPVPCLIHNEIFKMELRNDDWYYLCNSSATLSGTAWVPENKLMEIITYVQKLQKAELKAGREPFEGCIIIEPKSFD